MSASTFILTNPSITIATECTMFTISVLALLFNILVVYIILFHCKQRQVDSVIMGFIAIADILISMTVMGTQICKWITFHQILINPWFCQVSGFIYMLLTLTSIDGVAILSLVRALAVVKNIAIKPLYWYLTILLIFAFNALLNSLGLINQIMRVMPSEAYCQPSYRKNKFSQIISLIMIGQFFLMILVIIASYICITVKHCKLLSQYNLPMVSTNELSVQDRPVLAFYRNVIGRLFILVFMYMLCFLPELFTMLYNISTRTERTPVADAISGSAINLTILVNSLFVMFYHEETRRTVLSLLPSWLYYYRYNRDNYCINGSSNNY